MVKRHQRPIPGRPNLQVGVIEKEGPIHVSNVAIVDPKDNKPTRVGITPRRAGRAHARHQALGQRSWTDMARLKDRYNDEIRAGAGGASSATRRRCRRRGWSRSRSTWASARPSRTPRCSRPRRSSSPTIAGQKPNIRRARKSVAAFKLREGMPVGLTVTLRDERAYEFLDRLTSIAIPRIRDFRGLNPRSFDGRGNYSMGVREQVIFPEIDYDSDRPGPRARRHHHHHRADRRRGVRPARRARHAVRPRRAPGGLREPRPASPSPRKRPERPMAKTSKIVAPQRARRSTRRGRTRAAAAAAARAPSTASSACAGSACASSRTTASSPA